MTRYYRLNPLHWLLALFEFGWNDSGNLKIKSRRPPRMAQGER